MKTYLQVSTTIRRAMRTGVKYFANVLINYKSQSKNEN